MSVLDHWQHVIAMRPTSIYQAIVNMPIFHNVNMPMSVCDILGEIIVSVSHCNEAKVIDANSHDANTTS